MKIEKTQVGKWGNSLALRIPARLAAEADLKEGTPIELECRNHEIVIRPTTPRYSLDALLAGVTEENKHEAVETGAAVGEEVW